MTNKRKHALTVVAITWILIAQVFIGSTLSIYIIPDEYEVAFDLSAFILACGDVFAIMVYVMTEEK